MKKARVGWTERSEVQHPSGVHVGVRYAYSNLRGLIQILDQFAGFVKYDFLVNRLE